MKSKFKKAVSIGITIIFCLTGCGNNGGQAIDAAGASQTDSPVEESYGEFEAKAADNETSVGEIICNTEKDEASSSEDKPIDPTAQDKTEILYLELPKNNMDIDKIKNYHALDVTLFEKTNLSFLADYPQLKELMITIGEEDAVPDAWNESYAESYDFLNSLDNLEYLRISQEPSFNTKCLQNTDNLKYLHFYGTNVELEGYFPNIQELSVAGQNLSSNELYDFFPNLTELETHCIDIDLKSVGKMDKLETLKLGYYQSYSEINEISNNKNLRSLTLLSVKKDGSVETAENEDFLLELPNLEYFWCYEGVISDETINRLSDMKPQCNAFNHGLG
ncbi:MAG: hypothetical protein NC203_12140 [Firmicutes bacterium]|nr:hypothetical protein [[Eubacterium] siraeum]MCM1489104.1 hypothetical protein [Bacillota bacterium]